MKSSIKNKAIKKIKTFREASAHQIPSSWLHLCLLRSSPRVSKWSRGHTNAHKWCNREQRGAKIKVEPLRRRLYSFQEVCMCNCGHDGGLVTLVVPFPHESLWWHMHEGQVGSHTCTDTWNECRLGYQIANNVSLSYNLFPITCFDKLASLCKFPASCFLGLSQSCFRDCYWTLKFHKYCKNIWPCHQCLCRWHVLYTILKPAFH